MSSVVAIHQDIYRDTPPHITFRGSVNETTKNDQKHVNINIQKKTQWKSIDFSGV